MSSDAELRPFSYAVLGLVGHGGAGPHDIVRMMRRGRPYWSASPSHFYAEPKRLERLGYLDSRKEPGQTRERTHYVLTPKGERALREWLARPTPFPRIQHEGAARLMAADLAATEEDVLESLLALRSDLDELDEWLDGAEEAAAELPHRERYLRLTHNLGRRLVAAHREWLQDVERELRRS